MSTLPPRPAAPGPSRRRLSVGAAVVLGLVVLSVAVGLGLLRGQSPPVETIADSPSARASPDAPSSAEVYVHVLGEVAHPGLYILAAGTRVVDALAAAGGVLDVAELRSVNLARPLSDGEQIVVPAVGEVAVGVPPGGGAGADGGGPIDINTADQAALETLPRIGPALAQRILQWREQNGRFQSVEDLLAVPGIGEKLLAGLRDAVRV